MKHRNTYITALIALTLVILTAPRAGAMFAPTAPSNLTIDQTTTSSLRLQWVDNSSDEDGFIIQRALSLFGSYVNIDSTLADSIEYIDTALNDFTTYYYRIRSYDETGPSFGYASNSATTLLAVPDAPANLVLSDVTASSIRLDWDDMSDNEDEFLIERRTASTSWFEVYATGTDDVETWTDNGLNDETEYFYRVLASNSSGSSAPSNTESATTLLAPPDAPQNLTLSGATTSSIDLAWDDMSDNEDEFLIDRRTSITSWSQVHATGTDDVESWTDNGLDDDTEYFYRVRASNTAGQSAYTAIRSLKTLLELPLAPDLLTITDITTNSISLSWRDNSDNESGFQIERTEDLGLDFSLVYTAGENETTYTNIGLQDDTRYYYRIRAINGSGPSAYTDYVTGTTQLAIPASPSSLVLSDATDQSLRLTWEDNSDNEEGFEIERSPAPGNNFQWIYTTADDVFTYEDSGLEEFTEYYYRVRAVNGAGPSGYTNTAHATTLLLAPEAPSDLLLSNETVSSIDLEWTDNSELEEGFEIERSESEFTGYSVIETTVADVTSFTDTGLKDYTEYFYRMRSFNATGYSDYTPVVSTTTLLDLPGAPDRLNGSATTTCDVELTWRDRSHNESRFEIWRSFAAYSGFIMIDTVVADMEAYTDTTTQNHTQYYYRVRAANASGASAFSATEAVNVSFNLSGGTIAADQDICPMGDPEPLISLVPPSGANNVWTYQWQSHVNPGVYEDIEGAEGLGYDPPEGILETTVFRRVSTTECGVVMSNELTINVEDITAPEFTLCPSDTVVAIERNLSSGTFATTLPVVEDNCELNLLTWSLSGVTSGNSPSAGINLLGERTFNLGLTVVTYYAEDLSGNPSTCSFNVFVERKIPEIKSVSIPDASMKIGDVVSATITVSNDGGSHYSLVSGAVAGYPLYNPMPFFYRANDTTYLANFNILEGGQSYLAIEDIPVTNLIVSDGTDYSLPYSGSIVQPNDPLDAAIPEIFSMNVLPGIKKIGDVVQLNINADGVNYTIHSSSLLNGILVSASNILFSELGGGTYSLSYTVEEGDADVAPGEFTASIVLVKPSGNINPPFETISNASALTIDAHPPVVTQMEVPDIAVGIGGTVQVSITADGENYTAGSGTIINGIPLSSSRVNFASRGGGLYELSYQVADGDNSVAPGELEMTMVIVDEAGNPGEAFSTVSPNSLEIYTDRPIAVLGGTTDICEGEEAILTVFLDRGRPPWSFDLYDGSQTVTYENVSVTEFPFSVLPLTTTTYRITEVTDANGVTGNSSNPLTVTVNQATDVKIINLATGYSVEDDPVKLEANVPGGVFSGPGVISATGYFDPGLADTVNSPHTIVYTYVNENGCISTDSARVFVLGAEGIIDLPGSVFCVNGSAFTVTASNVAGDIGTFTLRNSQGGIAPGLIDNGDNTATVYPSQLTPGTYTIEYRYVDDVVLFLRKDFSVEAITEPTILNLEQGIYCQNTTPFMLQADKANVIFEGPGISGDMYSGFIFDPSDVEPGQIEIICTAVSANGCTASTSKFVTVLFAPDADFTMSTSCIPEEGGTVSFSNRTNGKLLVESWSWNFGDPASGNSNVSSLVEPVHFYSQAGERTITLTATTFEGCIATAVVDTIIGNHPVADFTWLSDCYANGSGVTFINKTHSEFAGLDGLVWSFMTMEGGVLGEIATDGSTDTVNFPFANIDSYQVELAATNMAGCSDTALKVITLKPSIVLTSEEFLENFNSEASDWSIHSEDDVASWTWGTPDFEGFVGDQGDKAWYTDLPQAASYEENSWIQSPCFDFSASERPLIKLDIMKSFDIGKDGAVLQYMDVIDEGWKTVGGTTAGLNWYNVANIANKPGGSYIGWGVDIGGPDEDWVTALHDLDGLVGKQNVSFRIAVAINSADAVGKQGFAFDNLVIGERSKRALLEHFTNASDASSLVADDYIDDFSASNPGDVIDLQYHVDYPGLDPMNENNPNAPFTRSNYYGIPQIPYAILDGGVNTIYRYDFSELKTAPVISHIKQISLEIPLFKINLSVDWHESALDVTTLVTCNTEQFENYIDLYVVILETQVTAYTGGNGDTEFRNVVLDMLPGPQGKLLGDNWTRGETDERSFSWDYAPYVEDAEDLAVVAFVSDRTTGRILQAAVKYADGTVGVGDSHHELMDMQIYPNPVKHSFYMNLGNRSDGDSYYQILDINGKLVMNQKVPSGYQVYEIDVSHLQRGIYLLQWYESDRIRGVGKFVKTE